MGLDTTKIIIYIVVLILCANPFMHDVGYYFPLPSLMGFNVIDILVIILVFIRIFQKYNSLGLYHVFLVYISIWFLISVFSSENSKLVFYAFRPILYLSVAFFDIGKVNKRTFENILILGVFIYTIVSLYILFFNPFLYAENSGVEQGRIAFHNDLILVPTSLVLLQRILVDKQNKYFYFFLMIMVLAKLVISMSRGLVSLYILSHLYSLYINRKLNLRFMLWFAIIALFIFEAFQFSGDFISNSSFDKTMFFEVLNGRFLGYHDPDWQETHVSSRYPMYWLGLKTVIMNPVFGIGFGTPIYVPEWSKYVYFVDSSFITLFMTLGFFGAILFFNFISDQIKILRSCFKKGVNKKIKEYLPIWMYLLVLFFINSVYISSPLNVVLIVFFMLLNAQNAKRVQLNKD